MAYVLRRIENFRLTNEHALKLAEMWKQIKHPGIVSLSDIFVSKELGGIPCKFYRGITTKHTQPYSLCIIITRLRSPLRQSISGRTVSPFQSLYFGVIFLN